MVFPSENRPHAITLGRVQTHPQRMLQQAQALHRQGKLDLARSGYEEFLRLQPGHVAARRLLATVLYQQAQHAQALQQAEQAFSQASDDSERAQLHNLRAAVWTDTGQKQQALEECTQAIALAPKLVEAYINRALLYRQLDKTDQAIQDYTNALALEPDSQHALRQLARLHQRQGQHEQALQCFTQLLTLTSGHSEDWYAKGLLHIRLAQFDSAVDCFRQSLSLDENKLAAWLGLGNAQKALEQFAQAMQSYDRAISLHPASANAYYNRAILHKAMGRNDAALLDYDQALALNPGHAMAHGNRGGLLLESGHVDEAVLSYRKACELHTHNARYANNLANALMMAGSHGEAAEAFARATLLDASVPEAQGLALQCSLIQADWSNLDTRIQSLEKAVQAGKMASPPFCLLPVCRDPALLQRSSSLYADFKLGSLTRTETVTPPQSVLRHAGKIRLAYLSADFRAHAVMQVMAEVFELHDRQQFEVFAYDYGRYADSHDAMRQRLQQAFDHFLAIADWSDAQIAAHMQANGIAIVIDLMGYTDKARPAILAQHPVPVAVNYIGYPGTMGSPHMDYVLADAVLIPDSDRRFYTEKVVRLPDCYLPSDRRRRLDTKCLSRGSEGLPDNAFVFCAFSNTYKLNPELFAIWMALLRQVPDSVLWLLGDNASIQHRLRQKAFACGVDPDRLVFAQRTGYSRYLGRFRLANLFLDTLPYNALATASDALWAGLPVLTCTGKTYVGRGASSMLLAAGLPELVTASLEDYQAQALHLATHPEALQALCNKMAATRTSCRLFDAPRHTRHLEAAYLGMCQRAEHGLPPEAFDIPPEASLPQAGMKREDADHAVRPACSISVKQKTQARPHITQVPSARQLLRQAINLHREGRLVEASERYHQVLAQDPANFTAISMIATLHTQQEQHEEALLWFDRALALNSTHAPAYNNRGISHAALNRLEGALQDYNRALELQPDFRDALVNRASALRKLGRVREALDDQNKALQMLPDDLITLGNKLNALMSLKEFSEATRVARRILALQTDDADVSAQLAWCLGQTKQWQAQEQQLVQVRADLQKGRRAGQPFYLLSAMDDPALLRRCSELALSPALLETYARAAPPALPTTEDGRLRLAYLSADFNGHAVMTVLGQVFSLHDHTRFDIYAYNYGKPIAKRKGRLLRKAFENFHEVGSWTDQSIADDMRHKGIQIVVDLMGYTQDTRQGILAQRPAPVIVNYIGYPGTMGTPWHDYVVGDAILIPPELQRHYSEQVVQLPDCYLPYDTRHRVARVSPRAAHGLPEHGMVFCAFSNNYKITRSVFRIWMRLLQQIDDSVLWLLDGDAGMKDVFAHEAAAAGISPQRLVYATRCGYSAYLARYAAADLFLDTSPYNALATASDALWMGVPVVTCTGQSYVGRGATSLLHAVGLPELAVPNLASYEALALHLARSPDALMNLRAHLQTVHDTARLFDTARYVRHLESAYLQMWKQAKDGLRPAGFQVKTSGSVAP